MRRICFHCGDISQSGGTERVTTVVASALVERGFDVMILSRSQGEHSRFPLHPAVALHSLHMERHSSNLSDHRVVWRVHHFLKQQKVDWIVDVDTILSGPTLLASLGTGAKVISWEHFNLNTNVGDWPQRFRRAAGRRLAARYSDAVVTLTERDRQLYLSRMKCSAPIIRIPNPVTLAPAQRPAREGRVVLAAGRLVPQKGFDLLLACWKIVCSAHSGWRLRIVGSGPDEASLREQALDLGVGDSVDFIPETRDMASEYSSAAIFVLSSRAEGFALVLLEARAFGLPSVSFDCDFGPAEMMNHDSDGFLVPKEDVRGLADSLLCLMRDDAKREEFGKRAFEDYRYSLENIMPLWERLLGSHDPAERQ
jgi:glycosyltransferase involved in cell wall biosynthesis